MSTSGNQGDKAGESHRGGYQSPRNAEERSIELDSEAARKDSELIETKAKLTSLESELKSATERLTTIYAATSAVLGQENILDDIVQLHQAAQQVNTSTQIRDEMIPNIQVTRCPSTVPTYQDAFELWMSATRGMVDVDRASIFLHQPDFQAGFQDAFLPWIHGTLCKTSEALKSRVQDSSVWSKDLLVQIITALQLLVSLQHASQTTIQWVCGLL